MPTSRLWIASRSAAFTFYVTERDAGLGDGDQLFRIALPGCGPLPMPGDPIHIELSVRLACDAEGRLQPRSVGSWSLNWCSPMGARSCLGSGGQLSMPEFSEPEDFEFTLQDENLIDGPGPTAEDVVACRPLGLEARWIETTAEPPAPWRVASEPPGSIGVYFDPAGTICSASVAPLVPFDLYILAKTSGISDCGFIGAEFRVVGLPFGWSVSTPVPPMAVLSGDVFGNGVNIAWGTCQQNAAGVVQLLHCTILPTTEVMDQPLSVVARNPPSNSQFPWPILVLCDMPTYSKTRVEGIGGILNPTSVPDCDAVIGTQPMSWTSVKHIYR